MNMVSIVYMKRLNNKLGYLIDLYESYCYRGIVFAIENIFMYPFQYYSTLCYAHPRHDADIACSGYSASYRQNQ